MYAVTLGGQAGAGAPEIGSMLSKTLDARYVELLALRRLSRQLGASVRAVTKKELAFASKKDRFVQKLELVFSQFGWYGADFSMGMPPYPLLEEEGAPGRLKELPGQISDKQYIQGIYDVAKTFVEDDQDLVLVKRAGCITIDHPQVFHIGLFAPKDFRVARMANRLQVGAGEADEIVTGLEHARSAWFAKIADADPMDRSLYSDVFELGSDTTDDYVASAVSSEIERHRPAVPDDSYDSLYTLLNPRP